jgi:hypothetical protein
MALIVGYHQIKRDSVKSRQIEYIGTWVSGRTSNKDKCTATVLNFIKPNLSTV